jgi:hypothetical protein
MQRAKIAPLAPVTPRTMDCLPEDDEGMAGLCGSGWCEVKEWRNPCYTADWL